MRQNAIELYVSPLTAYWEINSAVVSEQMLQHFFMLNMTREVLHVLAVVSDCSKGTLRLPCESREGFCE